MKIAQEIRAGNVIMLGKEPMVVQKAEFSKSAWCPSHKCSNA